MKIQDKFREVAFTLVELLVVIAIIGIVTALVVNGAVHAAVMRKNTMVEADKQKLLTMINSYQSKLNIYPPDNPLLSSAAAATTDQKTFDSWASTNALLYELTGATNLPGGLVVFNGTTTEFRNVFTRGGPANSDPTDPHDFFIPGPKTNEYASYLAGNPPICGLVAPVPLSNNVSLPNFWHYDASSGRRHNPNSFDLWAEYQIGSKNGLPVYRTNGNW